MKNNDTNGTQAATGASATQALELGTTFGSEAARFPVVLPAETERFVVNFGLGVDSTAALVGFFLAGVKPDAVYFSDPGNEWPESHDWVEQTFKPWLKTWGVEIIETSRSSSPIKTQRDENLGEESLRSRTLPSIAYINAKCTAKHKGEPLFALQRKSEVVTAELAAGRRVAKVIGYEVNETTRYYKTNRRTDRKPITTLDGTQVAYGETYVLDFFGGKEGEAMVPFYPLVDWMLTRDDCEALIEAVVGSFPRKSSCVFCPMSNDNDWADLAETHPALWTMTLAIEANAWNNVDKPSATGLRKRGLTGKATGIAHEWKRSLIQYATLAGLAVDARIDRIMRTRNLEVVAMIQGRDDDAAELRLAAREIVAEIMVEAYPTRYATQADAIAKLEDAPDSQLDVSKLKTQARTLAAI